MLVIFGIFFVNGRCLRKRNCFCTSESINCNGLISIPLAPIDFIRNIKVVDLKRCRLTQLSQLTTLNSWPNLEVVDVRDQQGTFECDINFDFAFKVLTDCVGVTQDYEITSVEDNDTLLFETTTNVLETTGYDTVTPKPPLPVQLSTNQTSSTSVPKSTLHFKPTKRVFPKPATRGLTTIKPSTITGPVIKNLTTTYAKVTRTPFDQETNWTIYKLHAFFIVTSALFIVAIILVIFMIIAYIYGGICTCLSKMRAAICMCLSCRSRHKDHDKDSDEGEGISVSSTTLFDVMELTDITTVPPPSPKRAADTLRPRFHDKEV